MGKLKKKNIFIRIISIVMILLGLGSIYFSNWFIDFFGNITPEQFLFNLKSPVTGTSDSMIIEMVKGPILLLGISIIIVVLGIIIINKICLSKNKSKTEKYFNKLSLFLSGIILIGGVIYSVYNLKLDDVIKTYFSNSNYIEDNYIDSRDVKMSFPKEKRNLIHIYLESVENSYFSKDLGGYMDVNLMPELAELSKEGISFSDTDKFGGPYQTYGSGWSVASMVNMSTGLPLKVPMDQNTYGLNGSFLPGAISIGDILETEGYNQTIMFGADADFGGLTTFFTSHGDFKVFDYKYAKKEKLIPEDYYVWWGFEDDKLYDYAKDEITRLYKEGKPFNFTMETADTHFPEGYLSKKAPTPHDKQYANVISYSTKETVDFVNWIKKQPFYKNTTIVITGDHLSMGTEFFKGWDPKYRRSVYNLILNPSVDTSKIKTNNREFAPLDFYPTILASMGVQIEGDRLGLGTNMFSDKQTLIERDGLQTFEKGLSDNSNFFTKKFLDDKGTSIFEDKLVTTREK